jgi:hypothetical protein
MSRAIASELKQIARDHLPTESMFKRALRRFRARRESRIGIEQTADRSRAQRLFEVNFRTTWTR